MGDGGTTPQEAAPWGSVLHCKPHQGWHPLLCTIGINLGLLAAGTMCGGVGPTGLCSYSSRTGQKGLILSFLKGCLYTLTFSKSFRSSQSALGFSYWGFDFLSSVAVFPQSVVNMLHWALLFSSAATAMEIGLSMTGSGTAQSSSTEASETISEVLTPASDLASPKASLTASPTVPRAAASSPAVTDGPIYTSVTCDSDQGRNCDRLPQQPVRGSQKLCSLSPQFQPYIFNS